MKESMKVRKPRSPVVVRMVRSSFEEFAKRIFHKGVKFREIGINLVKAVKNVPGPVPKRAVLQFLKISTAIDQPAEKGRRVSWASGLAGRRKFI